MDAIDGGVSYDKVYKKEMNIGVDVLPTIPKDTADRNRTSPFAFTGNKFEFRSLGAPISVAGPNIALNTIVAESLCDFADILEQADDFTGALNALIRDTIRKHRRIIFNGNNYAPEWREEAHRRGLIEWSTTAEALSHFMDEDNVRLFTRFGIFSEEEMRSRSEILLENYAKVLHIEALTMVEMVERDILPAVLRYSGELAHGVFQKERVGIDASLERDICASLSELSLSMRKRCDELKDAVAGADEAPAGVPRAFYYRDRVTHCMDALRRAVDACEPLVEKSKWPYPSYGELLFSVTW